MSILDDSCLYSPYTLIEDGLIGLVSRVLEPNGTYLFFFSYSHLHIETYNRFLIYQLSKSLQFITSKLSLSHHDHVFLAMFAFYMVPTLQITVFKAQQLLLIHHLQGIAIVVIVLLISNGDDSVLCPTNLENIVDTIFCFSCHLFLRVFSNTFAKEIWVLVHLGYLFN